MGISRVTGEGRQSRRLLTARLLRALARYASARPVPVCGVTLLLFGLLAATGLPPRVSGDLLRLLPEDDPAALALSQRYRLTGQEAAVFLTFAPGTDLGAVARRIEALETVRSTFHGFAPGLAMRLALVQMEPSRIEDITRRVRLVLHTLHPQMRLAALPVELATAPPPLLPPDTVMVFPVASHLDPEFAMRITEDLEAAVPEALWMAGPHVTIGRSVIGIRDDLLRTSVVSLVLVFAVVSVSFRDWRATLLLFPPLILAALSTVAAMNLLAGSINTFTSLGSAVLLGLGIDFGVHLTARYREERGLGLDRRSAVDRAWERTGPPCTAAALTSAATCLGLLAADFRGLSQLGAMLGLGILMCWLYMVVLLPVLLTAIDPPPTPVAVPRTRSRWRRPGLALVLIATGAIVALRPSVDFEYDISALRRDGMGWEELGAKQRGYREAGFPPAVVMTDAPAAAAQRLRSLLAQGALRHVRQVVVLDDVLPADQHRRWPAIEQLVAAARNPRTRLFPGPIRERLEALAGLDTKPVTRDELPDGLARMMGADADAHPVLLLLKGNLLDYRESRALADELASAAPDLRVASEFIAQAAIFESIQRDVPRIAVIVIPVLVLIVAAYLRSLRATFVASAALLVGLIWGWAALAVSGVRLNLVNIVFLPILVGMGIDVAIHMLHRVRDGATPDVALRTTGIATLVSTLTTIAGFAALTWAGNRGVRSIGELVVVGLPVVCAAALLVSLSAWSGEGRGEITDP